MGGAKAESRCGLIELLLDKTHICKHPLGLYWMYELHLPVLQDLLVCVELRTLLSLRARASAY